MILLGSWTVPLDALDLPGSCVTCPSEVVVTMHTSAAIDDCTSIRVLSFVRLNVFEEALFLSLIITHIESVSTV